MARFIFNNIDMDKYSWCNSVFQNIFFKNRSNIFFFFLELILHASLKLIRGNDFSFESNTV